MRQPLSFFSIAILAVYPTFLRISHMKISTRLLMLVGAAIVAIAAIGASSLSAIFCPDA
jgi:hypothetical protein